MAVSGIFHASTNIYGIVTIKGVGFTGTTAVSFGGAGAVSFTVVSDTVITARVGTGNTGDVSVTSTGVTSTLPNAFTLARMAPPGNALNFNGSGYVHIPGNQILVSNKLTMEVWLMPMDTVSNMMVFTQAAPLNHGLNLSLSAGNAINVEFGNA